MLDAIARLPAASALDASDTAASSTLAAIIDSETVRPEAERRQLTVLFVDLVGSTALSARLDPEAMGELIRAYQKKVAAEVARFEGHVAKYMGDGVLAYFGRPNAHEDDAERAVRAGLAIARSIAGLEAPDGGRLAARVGIATGLVVVGELVGDQEARERAVVGETPNLAARLQALAGPSEAVSSLQQAVELARRQQAKSLELDAATSLARLSADQGKRRQARDLLAPVYGWFTEGF